MTEDTNIPEVNNREECVITNGSAPEILDAISKEPIPQPGPQDDGLGVKITLNLQTESSKLLLACNSTPLIYNGEIYVVGGPPGMGKSHHTVGVTAGYIAAKHNIKGVDALDYQFPNTSTNKKMLIVETEETHYKSKQKLQRIFNRAKGQHYADVISNQETGELRSVDFRSVTEVMELSERKRIVQELVSTGRYEFVILDGGLDFVIEMNHTESCSEFARWIRALAAKYSFGVMITAHTNKSSTTELAGQYAGILYRYCRAMLLLRRMSDPNVIELTSDFSMGKLSSAGTRDTISMMRWSDEHSTFISERTAPDPLSTLVAYTDFQVIFEQAGVTVLPAKKLKEAYARAKGIDEGTAGNKISEAVVMGYLERVGKSRNTAYKLISQNATF